MSREKLISVGKGAAIAAAGAVLAYLGQWVAGGDLGAYGPLVAAVLAIAVNALRKYAQPDEE